MGKYSNYSIIKRQLFNSNNLRLKQRSKKVPLSKPENKDHKVDNGKTEEKEAG